jgi:NADH-quinone oxidoreductase subunit A
MLTEFGKVLLFFIIGIGLVGAAILSAMLVRPSKPNKIKQSTYECGEEPIGSPWVKFNLRFYIIALIFLIFEVEVVFLFPWALIFKSLGWFAFIEMIIFVVVLLVGLAYVWVKGDLEWDMPKPYIPKLKDLIISKNSNEKG